MSIYVVCFSRIHWYGLLPFMCKLHVLLAVLILEWFAEKLQLPMYSPTQTVTQNFKADKALTMTLMKKWLMNVVKTKRIYY